MSRPPRLDARVPYNDAKPVDDAEVLVDAVTVIGAGLAGSEAAWQLASRGVPVVLREMRPSVMGPAHRSQDFAELVCSNSFKSDAPDTAAGLLKRELAQLHSFILETARLTAVPAGAALAVDRDRFAAQVTNVLTGHPLVTVVRREADTIPDGDVILAGGPLASPAIESALSGIIGPGRLAFYDAAAPVLDGLTLDRSHVFEASRWGRGSGSDYLNIPLDRYEYERFVAELVTARRVIDKTFDGRELFSACQPIEEVARTGVDALRYGALKPVGLTDPRTGQRPWAVAQLRRENADGTAFNLVGFQTNLAFPEQRRVFGALPGLTSAEFLRYGVMHRNSFIDAPSTLSPGFAIRVAPAIRVAGQLAGTEGYLEAAATGLLAALDVIAGRTGVPPFVPPRTTALGALVSYATDPATVGYQPMHVNFGLVPPLPERVRGKRARYAAYAERATRDLAEAIDERPDLFGGRR